MVRDLDTDSYRVIRLDGNGNRIEAVTFSKSDAGEIVHPPLPAYGERFIMGALLLRGVEREAVLKEDIRSGVDHPCKLCLCPNGDILRSDGTAFDQTGNRKTIFRPDDVWRTIRSGYDQPISEKNLFVVCDRDTVWVFAHGELSRTTDIFVALKVTPPGGSSVPIMAAHIRKDGFDFWPLPGGAWAVELYPPHREPDAGDTPTWWIHPPGDDSFEVVDIQSILKKKRIWWERTHHFGVSFEGEIFALMEGLRNSRKLFFAWFGRAYPGRVFCLMEQESVIGEPFFPGMLRWHILRDMRGGGITVFQKPGSVKVLTRNHMTTSDLVRMLPKRDGLMVLGVERIFSDGGVFVLFLPVYHGKKRSHGYRLVSGYVRDGELEMVSQIDLKEIRLNRVDVESAGDRK
ncbi:hypothetical protein, partial [Thermoflexus sp.]|uniref:hypothetical protein n=1 Tax=Thermoflexus sp. TaxID=1969742 RepID=UPI002ADE4DF1